MPRQDLIPLRRGTKASWESANPTLAEGEPGFETDTYTLKVGDGSTPYTTLPALNMGIQYYNAQVNGFNVSKDNGDVERKFWKDDFSVDSSENYNSVLAGTVMFTPVSGYVEFSNSTITNFGHAVVLDHSFAVRKITGVFEPSNNGTDCGVIFGLSADGTFTFNDPSTAYIIPTNGIALIRHGQPNVYKISVRQNGTNVASSASIFYLDMVASTKTVIDIVIEMSEIKVYSNGVLKSTLAYAYSSDNLYPYIGYKGTTETLKWYELTVSPSISYADDFTIDTTERYQPVLGTVAYDDANKRMNVITATGANGKASGRLKSYKFTEGSQIYDVTLPTGADGDFITLVTHSANGLMTDGIGVGLQSDGAGNWNLATLSGTTVTEGADSGLNDADVARIEIEKDLTGQYWYYIYDASGTKPTTATGKLFTTLTEGYTGWYANGAGAETQTYAIDNISIRAESIMGRTNVPVEEPFWFRDEFSENSLGRYVAKTSTALIQDGKFIRTADYSTLYDMIPKNIDPTEISFIGSIPASGYIRLLWGWDGTTHTDYHPKNSIGLMVNATSITLFTNTNGSFTTLETYSTSVSLDTPHTFSITIGDTISVTYDDNEVIAYDDATIYKVGHIGIQLYNNGCYIDNLQITGTRIYDKPIHRGAMLESYYDGSEEVAGTCFVDDYNFDRLGEYTGVSASSVSVANALLTLADTTYIYPTAVSTGEGWYSFSLKRSAASGSVDVYVAGNTINFNNDGAIAFNGGAAESFAITAPSSAVTVGVLASGTSIAIYEAGVLKGTKTGLTLADSNFKLKRNTADWYIDNLIICGESAQFENGIAASITNVGGGARYDTVETIGITLENEVQSGRYHAYARYLGTVSGCILETVEARVENTTDSSSIIIGESARTFPLTFDTTMSEYLDEDVWLNYDDIGDEITFNLERASELEHVHPTIFVDSIALIPVSEVR